MCVCVCVLHACAADRHSAFEGLRAEECGILNGCENGRCVRVQEGYTCDCFAGFTLDLSRMACVGRRPLKKPKKKKTNQNPAVLVLCFTPAPLSACRCERVLGAEQPDVVVQERKVHQHGGLLPLRVPAGLQGLRQTQLLREDGQAANIHTHSAGGGRDQQGHKNHTHKLIMLHL